MVTYEHLRYVGAVDLSVIPARVQAHNMICVAVGQEKRVGGQIIAHVLKVVNADV